jgi:hypothetical protein
MHYACTLRVPNEREGLVGASLVLGCQAIDNVRDALTSAGDDGTTGRVLMGHVST